MTRVGAVYQELLTAQRPAPAREICGQVEHGKHTHREDRADDELEALPAGNRISPACTPYPRTATAVSVVRHHGLVPSRTTAPIAKMAAVVVDDNERR